MKASEFDVVIGFPADSRPGCQDSRHAPRQALVMARGFGQGSGRTRIPTFCPPGLTWSNAPYRRPFVPGGNTAALSSRYATHKARRKTRINRQSRAVIPEVSMVLQENFQACFGGNSSFFFCVGNQCKGQGITTEEPERFNCFQGFDIFTVFRFQKTGKNLNIKPPETNESFRSSGGGSCPCTDLPTQKKLDSPNRPGIFSAKPLTDLRDYGSLCY